MPTIAFSKGWRLWDRQLERDSVKRSLTPDDVRTAHKNSQLTVIQAIEGGDFLQGHLERVEEAYRRGLRHFGLLHDSDASVPLGDVYTNAPRYGGLTPFGAAVLKECNRLGIALEPKGSLIEPC
jgi:membrane dipeptidase